MGIKAEEKKYDLGKLFRRLSGISRIPKCSECSCLADTVRELQETSKGTQWEEKAAELLERLYVTHGCIGCMPCYPVAVSNVLYEVTGQREDICLACAGTPCETQVELSAPAWPIEVGDYLLGSPTASVAVTTASSTELPDLLFEESSPDSVAIVGKIETENIGVEKVVRNVISNLNIRFVVVCGKDAQGHFPGQTLLALSRNGMDPTHCVLGSPASRPLLKNLTEVEAEQFRAQVSTIDLLGCTNIKTIVQEIERWSEQNPGSFTAAASVRKVKRIVAEPPRKLSVDKAGFFIVYIDRLRNRIILEHYQTDARLNLVLEGKDAVSLYSTAIEHGLLGQLDHAAYLGNELARAELSLKHGLKYVQDRAPGE